MGRLSSEAILKEKQTTDPDSILSLTLTHKALSDVSCLRDFKNLERLDLSFNNLTSLEDLRDCVNLKWLSVVQNKLHSLKGIEGLTKLTVLNAGKNKIRSLDEVQKLINLRALIMNDNDIVTMGKLDELKHLNTIVLSRNPLRKMSLDKLKLISKLSLSNCQLEAIDSSIKACNELKELRLAHNDIKILPAELAHNMMLENLDVGNNLISRWSDLKVLSSLHRLKNINLHGNPIDEKDKLLKKIKQLVPTLQIFNSKPIEKYTKIEQASTVGEVLDVKEDAKNDEKNKKNSKEIVLGEDGVNDHKDAKNDKKKRKQEKKKTGILTQDSYKASSEKKPKRKADLDVIDDGDTPFVELVEADRTLALEQQGRSSRELDSLSCMVIEAAKNKKMKKKKGSGSSELQVLAQATEVGMGGPSAWDD